MKTRWLACRMRRPDAKARLVCFPHSGGAAGEYLRWADHLPDIEVWAVLLPGRASRLGEEPFTRMASLVRALVDAQTFEPPFAFFGHSLGALVAFEVAHELRLRGREQPCRLFLSACRAPHLPLRREPIHELGPDALLAALEGAYGGMPVELGDPDMRELILPALRADLTMGETYRCTSRPPLDVAMVVAGGDRDRVTREDLDAWQGHTARAFQAHTFTGGHFYFRQETAPLLSLVRENMP